MTYVMRDGALVEDEGRAEKRYMQLLLCHHIVDNFVSPLNMLLQTIPPALSFQLHHQHINCASPAWPLKPLPQYWMYATA